MKNAIAAHSVAPPLLLLCNRLLRLLVFEAVFNDVSKTRLHILANMLQVDSCSFNECLRDDIRGMHEAIMTNALKYVFGKDVVP